jgi:hypothetical protein
MRRTMDAFIAAVEDARHRLIRKEGQNVSMREVIRRAGYDDSQRAGVSYHLTTTKKWPNGHRVPPELVARLTGPRRDGKGKPGETVLPISHEELSSAAQVAAGYNLRVPGADLPTAYARFLGDHDVADGEKTEVTARLLQIIADETARKATTGG